MVSAIFATSVKVAKQESVIFILKLYQAAEQDSTKKTIVVIVYLYQITMDLNVLGLQVIKA
jgi:hypothetical protein